MEINNENPDLPFLNSRRIASHLQTLKTPFAQIFPIDYLHRYRMEHCAFVVAHTIDIETAPLTPSIARRFTSAQSSDSWCWGIGPCDSRASRSGFSRCLGCFTSVFPFSVLDGDCFSLSSTWSVAFLGADTQTGALREELHIWRFCRQLSRVSSMASMGWWGLSRNQRFVFGDHALDATQ